MLGNPPHRETNLSHADGPLRCVYHETADTAYQGKPLEGAKGLPRPESQSKFGKALPKNIRIDVYELLPHGKG